MNQQKNGRFIALLRKEKKMTQAQLAEKLGITDKAISKWETGKCMPDAALYIPLCETLDITVNELLRGERIKDEDAQKKADESIVQILNIIEKLKERRIILEGAILFIIGVVLNVLGKYSGTSNFGDFLNGLFLGLSVGMEIIGILLVVYGIAKTSRE